MTGEADAERLVVLLEARIRDFEKNLQKASGTAGREFGGIRRASKSAMAAMEADIERSSSRMNQWLASTSTRIGAFGKGLVGGLVAGGIAGVVSSLQQVLQSVATIGDEARRAGLNVKAFQELKYVAEQNRLGVDSLVDGMKELSLRTDEWITTGAGPAAEAFGRLGYTAQELRDKLKDPSALFTEIIGKLERLDRAAAIRIADEIFGGTGGEKFVQLLERGEQGIRDQIKAANDLDVILDEKTIAKADELDRKFNAVANTVGTALKQAIVDAAGALQQFVDGFNDFERQQVDTLKSSLDDAYKEIQTQKEFIGQRVELGMDTTEAMQHLEELTQKALQIRDIIDRRSGYAEDFVYKRTRQTRGGPARHTPGMIPLPQVVGEVPTPRSDPYFDDGDRSEARTRNAAATRSERDAVAELIAELEEELRLVGASDTDKQIAAALRRANVSAASAEGQQIIELVRAIDAETEALARNKEAQEARQASLETLFDMGGDAIMAIAEKSLTAEEAVKRLAVQLALAAAQAALFGSGPLSGLIGSIFGGGLGGGMSVPVPRLAIGSSAGPRGVMSAGLGGGIEPGRPLAMPAPPRPAPAAAAQAPGGIKVDVGVSVDENGNLHAFVRKVSQDTTRRGITEFAGSQLFTAGTKGALQRIKLGF